MMETDKKQMLTVSDIRSLNMENIMQSVIRGRIKTRSELAKENQISLMTVKHIVDDLIQDGILAEKTSGGAEVGRKPKSLEISSSYGNVVCVNLTAMDEISFLIYDIYETLLHEQTLEFDGARAYRENLSGAAAVIRRQLERLHMITVGVAVFVPGAYYEDADIVNYDLIGGLKGFPIKAFFAGALGVQNVLILHDVLAAARSEYDSLRPEQESQFYFYCGHGVGGFFIHKGVAVMGEKLMAGEVGKMLVHDGDGSYRMFENIASAAALDRTLKENGVRRSFKEVIQAYPEQDEAVKKIIDAAVAVIVRILYNLLWAYNPSRMVVDSCYDAYGALIIKRFKKFMESLQDEAIPMNVQVRQALYNEYHMMRGCFHMARSAWVKDIACSGKAEGNEVQGTKER